MPNKLNYSITDVTIIVECQCGHENDIYLGGLDDLDSDTTYSCDHCMAEFILGDKE